MRLASTTLALLTCCLASLAMAEEPKTYTIDPEHTEIGFSIRYVGVVPVRGVFTEYEGTMVFDEEDLSQSSVAVAIRAESIDTGVERRDRHLRSDDFFDVEQYPELTFRSTRFEKTAAGYQVVGPLTIHGVTKEVAIPFTLTDELLYPNTNSIMRGAEGRVTINRVDFGVGSEQAFLQVMKNGSAWASEEVEISLVVTWERRIPHVADLLAETVEQQGVAAARAQFDALLEAYGEADVYSFSTNAMQRAGKAFLEQGRVEAALLFFELNVAMQPDWWWLYPLLADTYLQKGNTGQAIATYEKLLELNPDHEEAVAALAKLRKGQ